MDSVDFGQDFGLDFGRMRYARILSSAEMAKAALVVVVVGMQSVRTKILESSFCGY